VREHGLGPLGRIRVRTRFLNTWRFVLRAESLFDKAAYIHENNLTLIEAVLTGDASALKLSAADRHMFLRAIEILVR